MQWLTRRPLLWQLWLLWLLRLLLLLLPLLLRTRLLCARRCLLGLLGLLRLL